MAVTRAVILAAGEGKRMHPLTCTRPKVMLPLANKPILEHLMLEMKLAGIQEIILVVGYYDDQIRNYFDDGGKWEINIRYCCQRKQLGTADALRLLDGTLKESFLLVNGDSIFYHEDISRLTVQTENVLSIIKLPDVTGLGVVEVKEGQVTRIYEKTVKPPSQLVNAGMYLLSPDIFEAAKKTARSMRGEYELTDSIQMLIDTGHKVLCQEIGSWLNFSFPWDLLTVNEKMMKDLASQNLGEIGPNVVIEEPVSVGKGSVIRSGTCISGPVIIGDNCDIGPNCFIRAGTVIAGNCHIGAGVELKNSIIMSGTKIPHLSYVGDSIIGEGCNLGAGTKVANLRLDRQNVRVDGINTGRRKLGAIIGDNVQTGINASINVGTMIGNNTVIGPGALASGNISPGSKIF